MKRPTPPCDHSGAPIPCQFDLRRLVKPRIDKRGRLLDGFEPLSAATQESTHRVKLLRQAQDPEAQALAAALEQCRRARRCGSQACPVCGRLRRIRTSASILRFLAAYPLQDLRYLTLINPADALPAGHLRTFDPKKLVNRFRRQFERAGIDKSKSFIVAQLDGEWDEGRDRYQPHLHGVVWGVDQKALTTLVEKWPRAKRVRSRKRLDPIDDLPRVVAYLDKTFWPSVARKNNRLSVYPHGKRRPPQSIEVEILIWQHYIRIEIWP